MDGPIEQNKRGKSVGSHKDVETFVACAAFCKATKLCHSFLYYAKNKVCYLKDSLLTGSEAIVKKNKNYFSAYKSCKEGKNNFYKC